jgi:ubiquinone/menaquinone biosynthesis C-methylase UbiE
MRSLSRRALRNLAPAGLLAATVNRRLPRLVRFATAGGLAAAWAAAYARYRRAGQARTAKEYQLLRTANWDTFTRHYNERVPTIEEEFDLWGDYHQHRHEMRYDLVAAAVRHHTPRHGQVLDLGCGSALVADRIRHLDAHYVGLDFGGHHVAYPALKYRDLDVALDTSFIRGQAEQLPFSDASFNTVVMSEVIEHLMRPELAVWEIARVLRPGGVFVMTTNNASEVPLRSPLADPFSWIEKAIGAYHPEIISSRPWIWPEPMDPSILPPNAPAVYMPHTHHIYAETRDLLAAAGLSSFSFSTFEFPPPQAATSGWLERRGAPGRRLVDAIEAACRRIPAVNKLGCHLFLLARKDSVPVSPAPPAHVWPGPFSREAAAPVTTADNTTGREGPVAVVER